MPFLATPMTQRRLTVCLSLLILLSFAALPAHADHIHFVLRSSAGFIDQDLTALTNGGIPNTDTGITAFPTLDTHHLHTYYQGTDQHVHQLYFNATNWVDQDLTVIANGPLALGLGGISGFTVGHLQHVFYLGNDLHVHQLFNQGAAWFDQDVTAAANGPVTDFDSLVAFQTADHKFHVYYLANNSNDIHQLVFNGTNWTDQNLRMIAHHEPSDRGWMAGFAVGNEQHLFFTGFSSSDKRHLVHLFFKNSKWVNQDLSAKVHGLPLSPATGITAFANSNTDLKAYCVTNDFDVHQITMKNNTVTDIDLSALVGAQSDNSLNQMAAFKTANNQFHVFYPPNDLYEFLFNGSNWSNLDVTTLTGGGIPNARGGMAGYAIKNQQYLFYVAH